MGATYDPFPTVDYFYARSRVGASTARDLDHDHAAILKFGMTLE